ncbi:MAG TPA: 2-dehydropantoate 2-reductase N-terminal domain-containing protein [Pseudolysinimonas sp.]|nr:2-dehydropantoate 2-reductase N-terminal domain-containing protein [Pseudolysinimonas sp.]
MTRYIVIGAGAVGGLLAAHLQGNGADVVLVGRGETAATIARDGLLIRRPASVDTVFLPVVGSPEAVPLKPDDVLVLAVKAQDAEAALAEWAWRPVEGGGLAVDLPIITLQNGIATERAALRRFRTVIGGTIVVAASHLAPGEIVSPSYPIVARIWLGEYSFTGGDVLIDEIAVEFSEAGFLTRAVADIRARKAWKLLGNVGNAVQVLAGDTETRARAEQLVRDETQAVFAAAGISVNVPDPDEWRITIEAVPGHVSGRFSTWQSFARGSSSEVDHLTGEVVLLGREHGVPTPYSELIQRALGEQSRTGEPPESRSLDELFLQSSTAS